MPIRFKRLLILFSLLLLGLAACTANPPRPAELPDAVVVIPTRASTEEETPSTNPAPTLSPTSEVTATAEPESSTATPPAATATPCVVNKSWPRYLVESGDTLFDIAQRTESTVAELQTANCLTNTLIQVNQELAVPKIPSVNHEPFETALTIEPIVQYEADIDGYLLETGRTVTLRWTPSGDWPVAAVEGNQLEFTYQPVNGFVESLAMLHNIPAAETTVEWTIPAETIGSISANFRWSGGEHNIKVNHQTIAAAQPNRCLFSPYGIGGGVSILQAADINSAIIAEAKPGDLLSTIAQGGQWEIPQTGQSGPFYQVISSNGTGWVPSYQGALVGTACADLPEKGDTTAELPTCERTWFFEDDPVKGEVCPLEVQETWAAFQPFERGTMLWFEKMGVYYILADTPLSAAVVDGKYPLLSAADPLTPVTDSTDEYTVPEGRYAPISGFGLLWRGDTSVSLGDLVSRLGWATAPEAGFSTIYQCDDALPSGGRTWQSCYIEGPHGEVIHILPPSYGQWRLESK